MIRQKCTWIVALILLLIATPSYAGITTIQALNFGEFIVKRNDAVYSINVNISGPGFTYDSAGFIPINTATIQHGVYDLDGMPANQAITSVTVTQITPLSGAGGPNFQLTAFQESHPPTTDGSGVARIRIGASAQTSGSGSAYLDQTYTGTVQIQINF